MAASTVPCANPGVCGVKSHRAGTVAAAECRNRSRSADGSEARRAASAAPVPSSVQDPAEQDAEEFADVASGLAYDTAENEDAVDDLAEVVGTNSSSMRGFLNSTGRFLERGERIEDDTQYARMLHSFVRNEGVHDVLADPYFFGESDDEESPWGKDPVEVSERLHRIEGALVEKDEYGLTASQREHVVGQARALAEVQEQIEELRQRESDLKEDLRRFDASFDGQGYVPLDDDLEVKVSRSFRVDPGLAEERLTPDEYKSTLRHVPAHDVFDASAARKSLPEERLKAILKPSTPSVSVRRI